MIRLMLTSALHRILISADHNYLALSIEAMVRYKRQGSFGSALFMLKSCGWSF
jgi:hypothetical protein